MRAITDSRLVYALALWLLASSGGGLAHVPPFPGAVEADYAVQSRGRAMTPLKDTTQDPPYAATAYIDPDWVSDDDPSLFSGFQSIGTWNVQMFDYRTGEFGRYDTHSFEIEFDNGHTVTARVNTEYDVAIAEEVVQLWGTTLGQLPEGMVMELGELHFQGDDDTEAMGANAFTDPTHIVVHRGWSDRASRSGSIQEGALHELAHVVFQPRVEDPEWLEAQEADNCFISTYARDYPLQEDLAESFVPYLALKLTPDRVSAADRENITSCISARSRVLDGWIQELGLSLYPIASGEPEEDSTFRVSLEEPLRGVTHMGIGNLRGWAVASSGIVKVEVFVDGAYIYDAPYGGLRGDVGVAFSEIENASNSGFSAAYNYSALTAGEHTITVVAHSELGNTVEKSATFNVVKFAESFISDPNAVDLGGASCSLEGDEVNLIDAIVDEMLYDVKLKWRKQEQGFEIIEIR